MENLVSFYIVSRRFGVPCRASSFLYTQVSIRSKYQICVMPYLEWCGHAVTCCAEQCAEPWCAYSSFISKQVYEYTHIILAQMHARFGLIFWSMAVLAFQGRSIDPKMPDHLISSNPCIGVSVAGETARGGKLYVSPVVDENEIYSCRICYFHS